MSPEDVQSDEGNAFEEFANMPTLVGAVNKESLDRAVTY